MPHLSITSHCCDTQHYVLYVCFVSDAECKVTPSSDSFSDALLSVGEDVENIMDKLNTISTKLDKEIFKLCAEEASTVAAALQETRELNSHNSLEFDSVHEQEVGEDGDDQNPTTMPPPPDAEQTSDSRFSNDDCNNVGETGEGLVVKSQGGDNDDSVSPDSLEETEKDTNKVNDEGKEEPKNEWITVG